MTRWEDVTKIAKDITPASSKTERLKNVISTSEVGKKLQLVNESLAKFLGEDVAARALEAPGPLRSYTDAAAKGLTYTVLKEAGILSETEGKIFEKSAALKIAKRLHMPLSQIMERAEALANDIGTSALKGLKLLGKGAAAAAAGAGLDVLFIVDMTAGTAGGGTLHERYERDPGLFFDGSWPPDKFCKEKIIMTDKTRKSLLDLDTAFKAEGFYGSATQDGRHGGAK
jgi:hypothetical protein